MAPKKEKVMVNNEERNIKNEVELSTIQEDVETIEDFLKDIIKEVNEEIVKLSKESIDARKTRERKIKQEAKEWHKVKEYLESYMDKKDDVTGLTKIEYWCGMEPKILEIKEIENIEEQ